MPAIWQGLAGSMCLQLPANVLDWQGQSVPLVVCLSVVQFFTHSKTSMIPLLILEVHHAIILEQICAHKDHMNVDMPCTALMQIVWT